MSNNADGVPLGLTSEHVNHTIDQLSLRMLESAAILPLAILTRRNGVAVPVPCREVTYPVGDPLIDPI